MPVRKLIVKAFVREVILDNDSVTITHNFNISTKNLKWHSRGCLTYTSRLAFHPTKRRCAPFCGEPRCASPRQAYAF